MAKRGIAFPFQATSRGRLMLYEAEPELRQVIVTNLQDCFSGNPFQEPELGLGSEFIFAISDSSLQAELRRRIQFIFRRLLLQNRATLKKAPTFIERPETQELEVVISYINLEENKEDELNIMFSSGKSGISATKAFIYPVSKTAGS